jgi:DNA-binding transcriptional MerR regulator
VSDPRRHLATIGPHPEAIDAELPSLPVSGELLLQVGDLAKATGKTVRAIHLYESLGLIEPARRSKGRYRLFSPDTKVRVRWISKMQSLGLSLSEIQGIVQQRESSESARLAARDLHDVYKAKLEEVRASIREYRALEAELEASVTYLETCDTNCSGDVAATGCAACTRHPETPFTAPDLIVGARVAH